MPVKLVVVLMVTAAPDVRLTVSTPVTVAPVGMPGTAAVDTIFITSAPAPPSTVSPDVNDRTAPPDVCSSPAAMVSAPDSASN